VFSLFPQSSSIFNFRVIPLAPHSFLSHSLIGTARDRLPQPGRSCQYLKPLAPSKLHFFVYLTQLRNPTDLGALLRQSSVTCFFSLDSLQPLWSVHMIFRRFPGPHYFEFARAFLIISFFFIGFFPVEMVL